MVKIALRMNEFAGKYPNCYASLIPDRHEIFISQTNRLSNFCPAFILLSFQPSQVDGGYCQIGAVQKSAHVFYCFPCITVKLGSGVTEDVYSKRCNSGLFKILLLSDIQ